MSRQIEQSPTPLSLQTAISLVVIILLAFFLRMSYLFFLKSHYFFHDYPSSDVTYYREWAQEIASGNWLGSKTFYGLPLYPYFLAVLERLTFGQDFLLRFLHICLGALNCGLIFLVARRVFSFGPAFLAGLLSATNFILIYYDWLMMPVTLLITLSLLVMFGLYDEKLGKNSRHAFLLGILIGLSILGDGKMMFFLLMAVVYLMWPEQKPWPQKIRHLIIPLFAGTLLMVFPVTLRNKLVGGNWVLISAQSGLSFYAGNNPEAAGFYEHPFFMRPSHTGQDEDQKIIAQAIAKRQLSDSEVSHFWSNKAIAFIKEKPTAYVQLLVRKVVLFFKDTEMSHDLDLLFQRDYRLKFDWNPYLIICPLAMLGMWVAWRQRKNTAFFNMIIFSQLIMTLIFFLTTRHRASILPFFLIYEAFAFCWLAEKFWKREWLKGGLAFAAVFAAVILLPEEFRAEEDLNFAQASKSAAIYFDRKQYEESQLAFFQAHRLQPWDTNTLMGIGNTFMMQNNIPIAEQYYLLALKSCQYNVDVIFNLGYTYETMGRKTGDPQLLAKALDYFQQAFSYQPESLDIHFHLATILQDQGECQKAQPHFRFILNKQPHLKDSLQPFMASCTIGTEAQL
jgi:tetratricopeptide (TPR) repeat protein